MKLLEALQSYRVSFSLLPMPAKSAAAATSTTANKPAKRSNSGGKGKKPFVQKPWLKNKDGKGGVKGKMRVPQHIYKLGGTASNPTGDPICFASTAHQGIMMQRMELGAGGGLHICAKCYNTHPIQQHPALGQACESSH